MRSVPIRSSPSLSVCCNRKEDFKINLLFVCCVVVVEGMIRLGKQAKQILKRSLIALPKPFERIYNSKDFL